MTVPNPIEDGTILIFVNNADRTVLKSLNFISGTMSISADAVMVDADGDDVSVDLSTDLQYTVKVPEEATWVHYNNITTKSSMRNETINFTVDENATPNPRSTIIELVNGSGLTIGNVTICQSANIMQPNEIWYTSKNGQIITPFDEEAFDANIVSNVYGKSKGVITFDSNISRIGYQAFAGKGELLSISIPDEVTIIGDKAFRFCTSLSSITIPNMVSAIGDEAFLQNKITSIILPDSLRTIGENAFWQCYELSSVTVPNKVTLLGMGAFQECSSLTNVILPESLKTISDNAFRECRALISINLPSDLEEIGDYAFAYCISLKSVVIPENLSYRLMNTFLDCSSLETISLSTSGDYITTFSNCTKIKEVYIKGFPPSINKEVFNNVSLNKITLFVPKGLKSIYENTVVYKDFGTIVEVDSITVKTPEAVDLGLSVKWASFNLGAQAPNQTGLYLAWGELAPKTVYNWSTYKWCEGSASTLTKYNDNDSYGTVDNKTSLDLVDDAANRILGGSWHIPSFDDFKELHDNCTWKWTTYNGVYGYKVSSKKAGYEGNYIFLPTSGCRFDSNVVYVGSEGRYWCNDLGAGGPYDAYYYCIYLSTHSTSNMFRYYGYTIRPVCP